MMSPALNRGLRKLGRTFLQVIASGGATAIVDTISNGLDPQARMIWTFAWLMFFTFAQNTLETQGIIPTLFPSPGLVTEKTGGVIGKAVDTAAETVGETVGTVAAVATETGEIAATVTDTAGDVVGTIGDVVVKASDTTNSAAPKPVKTRKATKTSSPTKKFTETINPTKKSTGNKKSKGIT